MKKYVWYLMTVLCTLCLWACDDDENGSGGSIEPVSHVTSTPFIGSVILNWENPASEDFYYVAISYTGSDGSQVRKKVSRYDVNEAGLAETIIGGFTDTNEYLFTLQAVGYSGAVSSPVEVAGTPQSTEEARNYVIETVTVEPVSSGARVSWVNETGVPVNLIASYVNQKGEAQEVVIDATSTGSSVLGGMVETTVISIVAENAEEAGRTEVRTFEVTPLIDPDDIIYDDIDYITFGSGANLLTWEQSNPDNPYEYTFVTGGNDPFINCNGMANQIAGTTLVFRYQATEAFTLELFWCDAGGGAAGGRSTSVSVPENNTGEWQTFRYDYADAMTQHAWAGKAGDFMRFDLGNKAGVTIQMKNIHFE